MAVLVQYAHQPASGTASRCSTPTNVPVYEPLCLPDYVPRTSPSVEHIFAKHEDALYLHDARTLGSERPASTTSARNRPSKSKANHAKLHRKRGPSPSSNYTTSRPKAKKKADVDEELFALSNLPEAFSFEPSMRPSSGSRSPTKERLRSNLRKFSAQKELDDLSLDLSMTAEENAERLGLAIRASDSTSSLFRVGASISPSKPPQYHGRSRSNGSQISLNSSLFTPTAPYSFNLQHTAQPYTPPTSYSPGAETSPSSITPDELQPEFMPPDAIKEEAEGDEFEANDLQVEEGARSSLQLTRVSSSITKTESVLCSPPSLCNTTTLDSRSCMTPSTSDLSFRLRNLSRRSTDVSSEVGTPRSVSSFSFRPKIKEENIDPVKRAASIAAARRAFAEREEEKTRKYEDRLKKKATEKHQRKHTWASSREQSLDNGSSSSSFSASRSTSIDAGINEMTLYSREYSQLTPVPSHALPTTVSTLNHVAIRKNKKKSSSSTASTRKSSGSRRAAKGVYVRSFLWLKMRMLNLARQSKSGQSKSGKKSSTSSSSSSSSSTSTTSQTASS